jgi:cytochrome c556
MKIVVSVLASLSALGILIGTLSTRAADPERDEKRDAILMRAKLAASQQTLEGLMYGDFDLIDRGARQLRDIDEWHTVKRDAVYDHYSAEFHRLSEKLVRLAKEKNAEGALYAYQHLTTTCVTCHEYVRDVKPAK